ncbi:MAG: trypsin-like peptidase domain-containing protein [Gammaproteobacteria bacterium]|jgi:S1-C subfamily serine protease|nr:trypsin-like peptidase domain-containing protein [Gammaproteobacteria bacterium]
MMSLLRVLVTAWDCPPVWPDVRCWRALVWVLAAVVVPAPALLAANESGSERDNWSRTLERISTGVVSLSIDMARSFDTDRNSSSQATGFVVDAEQGLILTNRHVVTPGPVRAEALFLNQEEVPLQAVYRDPVHDFGLFRYNPSDLRFLAPAALSLTPERAAVGREIRVVGNDAGEQLSILSGTIARLDRRAPVYGYGDYNDFNTFYYQAASGSSGGSSGSPVIDQSGGVVALNAGASTNAASSFFLPLERVKRAVELIQSGRPVTRGTLQTQFVQISYDELRRLGLQDATESEYRQTFAGGTGMLVVVDVLRGSPAAGKLRVGDILLALNGRPVVEFVALESVLDDQVGGRVSLTIERNGVPMTHDIEVSDLHAITPDEYLQFGNGVVHNLSYQQAWHLNRPLTGAYVAEPGYVFGTAGVPRMAVITEMNGRPVSNIDDLEAVVAELADGQQASARFFTMEDPVTTQQAIVRMDRRWFPAMRCKQNLRNGEWPCEPLADAPASLPQDATSAQYPDQPDRGRQKISQSLVLVQFDMPYVFSGVAEQHYYGTGVVLDAERGLVVVDRNTVPEALGDVRLVFAGSAEIRGRVEFIHPLHNLAIVSYDPALLGATPVRSAVLHAGEPPLGATLRAVGLRSDSSLLSQEVRVAAIEAARVPLSRSLRFRETNLDTVSLVNPPRGIDGVLMDSRARVVALWSTFAFDAGNDVGQESAGIPAEIVAEALDVVRRGARLHSLEAELTQLPLAAARNFGLPDEWAQRLIAHDPDRRQVLAVTRLVAGTPAAARLRTGDLLLAIDGQPVNRFREVERAVQQPEVDVTVWRNGELLQLSVPTVALSGQGVRRLVRWAGALLQAPYRDMAAQRGIPPAGVYVAYFSYGSPASRAGLVPGMRIVEVNGQPVSNLDEFLRQVETIADRSSVRLTTRAWNDAVDVLTVKLDKTFWPAWELVFDAGWQRRPVDSPASGTGG